MMPCKCYHIRKNLRYLSEFEQGIEFARTGKRKTAIEETLSECWGTKERDLCSCNGDRSNCDFYPKNRLEWFNPYREILDYHGIEYALYDDVSCDLIESSSDYFKPQIKQRMYLGANGAIMSKVVTSDGDRKDITLIHVRQKGVVLAFPTSELSSEIDEPLFILMNA